MSTMVAREQVEAMVREMLRQRTSAAQDGYRPNLVANISARHCHLMQEHVEILFGPGSKLTPMKTLYQSTDFAANETVAVVGPRQRMIPNVRILGH
ncbi:MAG: transcriptional regulator, partial [Planctomycetota bacterium]|nr:transcriptional regulator [Planctomycetota bacterium]